MILVDSSIWIDHFRRGDLRLKSLLEAEQVVTHSFIIGELAIGGLNQSRIVIPFLQNLPQATEASHDEILGFIERNALSGIGIGYIDAHLLASARLTSVSLWTRDKRLHEAAKRLGLADLVN